MKAAKKTKTVAKKAAKKPAAKVKKPATGKKSPAKPAKKASKPAAKANKPTEKAKPRVKTTSADKKSVNRKVPAAKRPAKPEKEARKKETKAKHWFPKDAKPAIPDKAPAKKSPWQRKMVPINYGTIGGPVTNIKDLFHKYIDDNHKKMTPEQRQSLWQAVGMRMIGNDRLSLSEIIDQEIKGSSGSI